MSPTPVTPAGAAAQALKKYNRHVGSWSVGDDASLPFGIPLHPPTEAQALASVSAAVDWAKSWEGAADVLWTERRWASLGQQRIPDRVQLDTPGAVAAFAGKTTHWQRASFRAKALLDSVPLPPSDRFASAVGRSAVELAALAPEDFTRLAGVLEWLRVHPASGLYIRQLPIRGVDTKWVQKYRPLVTRLHEAATGRSGLGLADKPDLVRVRFLDPALAPGGLADLAAPVTELAAMDLSPEVVYVFENLESVLAMPPLPGAVVVHGSGYAVDRLARIPWIRDHGVVYWGDLDSHGFGILNRLRAQNIAVVTVLMDVATLEAFKDLWGHEPKPAVGFMQHLLPEELAVVEQLAVRGNVRLEQERIDWMTAMAVLISTRR
ncbi:Wadjet anti-phage system protein JetD domain-containing protein [Arthrobacter pascens]|uniref:Wadjet anti-phage system protein JetD domain-containing protein n=1 Tax=Arthrobacter pascens TaxID=1677 RepID=UPI00196A2EB6|nr:Wadjet anti-phage system protein JetD domain-containing protein [Arthrobacter pascens]MBN3498342.1 hypothetical protein [Arthrobacter pascens]